VLPLRASCRHLAAADGRWSDASAGYDAALSDEAGIDVDGQALERIADGDSNKLIARAFDISPHTVSATSPTSSTRSA
jgi:DNA invertase Pin-like site-specific DNA recombinase